MGEESRTVNEEELLRTPLHLTSTTNNQEAGQSSTNSGTRAEAVIVHFPEHYHPWVHHPTRLLSLTELKASLIRHTREFDRLSSKDYPPFNVR